MSTRHTQKKRRYGIRSLLITTLALLWPSAWSSISAATSFTDSNLVVDNWTFYQETLGTPGSSWQTYAQTTSNGNPSPSLNIENRFTGVGSIWGYHFSNTAIYAPQTDGPIASVAYSEDYWGFPGPGHGQAAGIALRQNGKNYYYRTHYANQGTTWARVSVTKITSASFATLQNANDQPDFSAAGANIQFGFYRANGNTSSGSDVRSGGIDNWSVVLNPASQTDLLLMTSPNGDGCPKCDPNQSRRPQPAMITTDPIRYADGALIMSEDDLNLGPSGSVFERNYSNLIAHISSELGSSWTTERQPRIVIDAGNYLVRTDAHSQVAFTPGAGNTWVPIRSARETLTTNAAGDLVFADPTGSVIVFNGFNATIPVRQQGRVKRMYTSSGLPIVSTYDTNGFMQSQTRSTTTVGLGEVLAFTYDPTSGLLTAVERRQQPAGGGAQVLICRAEYGFDTTTSQLRSVMVKDPAGAVLRRFHYRYYTVAETGSSIGMLRNAVGPRTYARMQQAGIDPETATDALISAWADKSFQYDASRRVTQQVLRTPDVDGSGTYNYTYTPRTSPPATPGPNDWMMRFGETQPDGSVNTVFTNQAGDVMFKQTATSAGVVVSAEAWRFDAGWRATWHITPAAMQASGGVWFDAAQTDVLGFGGGNSPYVNDTVGLIERWTYFATTGSGGAAGYLQHEQTQQGELGTPTLLKSYTYVASP